MRVTWAQVHALRMRRHFLGTGETPSAEVVAHHVGGLQAQVASGPPASLLARNAMGDAGSLVRMWTLRGTVHLVCAEDVDIYAAALGASVAARETKLWPKQGVPANAEVAVTEAVLDVLDGGPLDRHALAIAVGERLGASYRRLLEHPWGIGFKPAVARGLLRMEGSGADVRFSRPLGPPRSVDEVEAQQWLARVYLTANVAGDAASFATWTGLSRAASRAALAAVAEQELTIDGRTYDAIGWSPDTPLTAEAVRLPAFDPFTLAVADKSSFCTPALQSQIWKSGGWVAPIVVQDGLAIDTWNPRTERRPRPT
jgi:hypothetical protein